MRWRLDDPGAGCYGHQDVVHFLKGNSEIVVINGVGTSDQMAHIWFDPNDRKAGLRSFDELIEP